MSEMQRELFTKSDLEIKFDEFDAANPAVWNLFDDTVMEHIEFGVTHLSADYIVHVLRYKALKTRSKDGFMINNNHVAYYARKFARLRSEHASIFQFKTVRVHAGKRSKNSRPRRLGSDD